MRRLGMMVLTLGAVAFSAGNASAQGRGGFGGPGMLLTNKGVQKEIKADEDQAKKLDAFGAEMRTKATEAREKLQDLDQDARREKMTELNKTWGAEVDKAIREILKPEQVARFKQIQLQARGAQAFGDAKLAEKLKITDDQTSKIKEITDAANEQRREIFQSAGDDREAAMKKMTELNKEINGKVVAIMTDDQKATWKTMTGEPYTVVFERPAGN